MEATLDYNDRICDFLHQHQIMHWHKEGIISIHRDSMVHEMSDGDEQSAYDNTLQGIKDHLGDQAHIMWSCRTDEFMTLVVYPKQDS